MMTVFRNYLLLGLLAASPASPDTVTAPLETRMKAERALSKVSAELFVLGYDAQCNLIDKQHFKRRKLPASVTFKTGLNYLLRAQFRVGGFVNTTTLSSEHAFTPSNKNYKVILNYLDTGFGVTLLENGSPVTWSRGNC